MLNVDLIEEFTEGEKIYIPPSAGVSKNSSSKPSAPKNYLVKPQKTSEIVRKTLVKCQAIKNAEITTNWSPAITKPEIVSMFNLKSFCLFVKSHNTE